MLQAGWFVLVFLTAGVSIATDLRSVFGFTFGAPIDLPECRFETSVTSGYKVYAEYQLQTCLEAKNEHAGKVVERSLHFSSEDMPKIISGGFVEIMTSDDALIGVRFATSGIKDQAAVLQDLRSKYGVPTSVYTTSVQNSFGATYKVIHAKWKLRGLSVSFDGARDTLDAGRVYIDTPEAVKARVEWDAPHEGRKL